MTCSLERPTPQGLFDRIKGNFEANVLGGYTVIPESNEWYVVTNDYAMAEEFYSVAEAQWKARDPRYACCDDLYTMAAARGVYPLSAGFAQGYARITGTALTAIPSPVSIVVGTQTYNSVGTVPALMPAAGFVDIRIKAVVPGTDGNAAIQSNSGSLANAVAGLDNAVTIYGTTFCGGSAAETCEEFRARYIERIAYQPNANASWLQAKIMEWPCVTRVFARSGSCCTVVGSGVDDGDCGCAACGCNTCTQDLNFYAMFDNTFSCGIPPQCVIDDLNTWLWGDPVGRGLGQAPIGVCGKIYLPVAALIDIAITGIQCATATQITQVKERIADVFKTAVPSEIFTARGVELAIAQVVGTSSTFEVTFTAPNNDVAISGCYIDPECDVLPCLNEITIVGADVGTGVC